MLTQRILLILLALVPLLLAGMIWNLSIEPSQRQAGVETERDHLPDSILEGAVIREFNGQGEAFQRLASERILSRGDGSNIDLMAPDLTLTAADGTIWSAVSESGRIDREAGRVNLDGEVRILRRGERVTRMETRDLAWDPARSVAHSDQAVSIEAPGHRVEARGISIDVDNASFELHQSVSGIHEAL